MLRIIWPLTQNLDKGFYACGKLFATACTIMHLFSRQSMKKIVQKKNDKNLKKDYIPLDCAPKEDLDRFIGGGS